MGKTIAAPHWAAMPVRAAAEHRKNSTVQDNTGVYETIYMELPMFRDDFPR